jgi:Carboxypeptidase regulatory-like domain
VTAVLFFLLDRQTNMDPTTPVTVTLGLFTAVESGADTRAFFPAMPAPGTYQYQTQAAGYESATGLLLLDALGNPTITNADPPPASVSVDASGDVIIDIYLTPSSLPPTDGELDVTVHASTGGVVAGAVVAISGPTVASTQTDATGVARFPAIPAGTYTLTVSASSYQAGSGTGTVVGGSTSPATVTLTPTGGGPPPPAPGSTSTNWLLIGGMVAGAAGLYLLARSSEQPPRRRGAAR